MILVTLATLLFTFAPPFEATVVAVYDGDTVTVLTTETIKIRLDGIDAPELKQPHGQASKQALSALVFGKVITVKPKSKDRYGRTVARLEADGIDVNLQMVATGHAHWYEQYAKNDMPLANAQAKAKAEKAGIWIDLNAIPPWEFRKKKKEVPK